MDNFAPIVADAEAGFGGVLNAFELMKAMIKAGAGGVHWEDQLSICQKCGHMGGKVLLPTRESCSKADRSAYGCRRVRRANFGDCPYRCGSRRFVDQRPRRDDKPFLTGERTAEGFYKTRKGFDQAVSRAIAYADYADLVWC